MTQISVRGVRLRIVGAILGLGLFGLLRRRRRRRPTAQELLAMDDRAFAAFVASTGLQTVTSAGLGTSEVSAD